VDIIRDVIATVHAGSEALWEDDDKLSLLLDRSTYLHATDLPQLVRWHLVRDNTTYWTLPNTKTVKGKGRVLGKAMPTWSLGALYSLWSGSWSAKANDTTLHYAAIHCPCRNQPHKAFSPRQKATHCACPWTDGQAVLTGANGLV